MEYEIINHGYCGSQYFQGCGVAFTRFDECVTGCGNDAVEAYDDALEMMAQGGHDYSKLPTKPRGYGITKRHKIPAVIANSEDCDSYWYVSIRYTTK